MACAKAFMLASEKMDDRLNRKLRHEHCPQMHEIYDLGVRTT
jgi:hypothetical protein